MYVLRLNLTTEATKNMDLVNFCYQYVQYRRDCDSAVGVVQHVLEGQDLKDVNALSDVFTHMSGRFFSIFAAVDMIFKIGQRPVESEEAACELLEAFFPTVK